MALATVNDLVTRWDQRIVADLASDSGQPAADLQSNARVLAALSGASGEVRAAVLKGRRYTLEDLQTLSADDAAYLKDLVCGLAILRLAVTRVNTLGAETVEALRKDMRERLAELERGERIFATESAQDGGLPKTEGPRLADYMRLNLMVDRCSRFYPDRASDLPLTR